MLGANRKFLKVTNLPLEFELQRKEWPQIWKEHGELVK